MVVHNKGRLEDGVVVCASGGHLSVDVAFKAVGLRRLVVMIRRLTVLNDDRSRVQLDLGAPKSLLDNKSVLAPWGVEIEQF